MSFIRELDAGWVAPHRIPTKEEREAFYSSRIWFAIRDNAQKRDLYQCRICEKERAVDGHHLTYENWGGHEDPKDILSLCRKCHGKVHGKIEDPGGHAKEREMMEHLFNQHISGVSLSGAFCGCDRCFYFWKQHEIYNLGAFMV